MDGPCDLVAQSMGGVIALSLALEHPELVTPPGAHRHIRRHRRFALRRRRLASRRENARRPRSTRHLVHRRPHGPHVADSRIDRGAHAADLGRRRPHQPARRRRVPGVPSTSRPVRRRARRPRPPLGPSGRHGGADQCVPARAPAIGRTRREHAGAPGSRPHLRPHRDEPAHHHPAHGAFFIVVAGASHRLRHSPWACRRASRR